MIDVRAHPGAARPKVAWDGRVLHVWVTARPVDGAANEAVLRAVADALKLRRSQLRLVGGATARRKRVELEGVEAECLDRLPGL